MPFWSEKNIEPKRENRWLLYIKDFDPFLISSFKKPSLQISHSEYQLINDVFYKPNIATWNESSCVITDVEHSKDVPVKFNATRTLVLKLSQMGIKWPTDGFPRPPINVGDDPEFPYIDQNGYQPHSSITKTAMNSSLGVIKYQQINSDGKPIEEWKLFNTSLVSFDPGEVGYEKDGICKINLGIKYDYATFKTLKT